MNNREFKEFQRVFDGGDKRNMTVGELIAMLKEYPSDSGIDLRICGEMNPILEIKGVQATVEAETNQVRPVIDIAEESVFTKPYAMVIELKKHLSGEELQHARTCIENAFVNRGGTIRNNCLEPYRLEFLGDEEKRGCMDLGMIAIEKDREALSQIISWKWYDRDNPRESCDVMRELMNETESV